MFLVFFWFFSFKNLAQTHVLNELMYEIKEKGTKLKICHTSDSQLVSMHREIQIWENVGRSWRTGNQITVKGTLLLSHFLCILVVQLVYVTCELTSFAKIITQLWRRRKNYLLSHFVILKYQIMPELKKEQLVYFSLLFIFFSMNVRYRKQSVWLQKVSMKYFPSQPFIDKSCKVYCVLHRPGD